MRQAALSLGLPVSTLIVAQTLFHFFYARKSYLEHDIRDIMMGCIYLACKSEETLRNTYEITLVFDYLYKVPLFVYRSTRGIRNYSQLSMARWSTST